MTSTLTVLCPNARRQTVKASPNTKILELLQEVCKKQGLETSNYDLVFQKKHLDVTLTFRLSGVPNNAQLELVKLDKGPRQLSEISVCLQLENVAERLAPRQFKPDSTNFFQLLEAFSQDHEQVRTAIQIENRDDSNQPIVSYLNDQVVGHFQLKNTTLLDLGLASGRFVIKLSEKRIESSEMNRLDAEFRAKMEKKSRLDEIYAKKQSEITNQEQTEPSLGSQRVASNLGSGCEIVQEIRPTEPLDVHEERKHESKRARIDQTTPSQTPVVSSNRTNERLPQQPVYEFQNFKFPEETRGQDLVGSMNELEVIERESREACEREAVRFSLIDKREEDMTGGDVETTTPSTSSALTNIEEDFYVVTIDDVRSRMKDLQRAQNEDAPLMTRQMREMEKDKRAMKYSKVAVRISFKNRSILQGLFRPKEPIGNLYKFVKSCLSKTSSADDEFKLFITPPKKILSDMKQTLFDAGLYPASIVYFKPLQQIEPDLSDDIKKVSVEEANEIVEVNVHKAMRAIDDHEGFRWLEKESALVQSILKNTIQEPRHQQNDGSNTSARASRNSGLDDAASKKMAKFMGLKK